MHRLLGNLHRIVHLIARSSPSILAPSIIAFVALMGVGFLPLFGGPGYESALAAGLILPSLAAIAAAFATHDAATVPSAAFLRGVARALVLSAVTLATVLVHGVRVGFCDAWDGVLIFVLGPVMGSIVGACWGFVLGQVVPFSLRSRRRVLLLICASVSGPLMGVVVSLIRFYSSPMVFAYDPFFGFFSGTLYDTTVTDSLNTLLMYRLGSLATVVAIGGSAFLVRRDGKGCLRFAKDCNLGLAAATALAALVSLIMTAQGSRFDHWHTADSIVETLGARMVDDRCELIYPRGIPDFSASLLLRDCATQAREVISALGVESPPRVRVYMFANQEQKRRLTGAAGTSVAKPWRKEVYVQLSEYPHPILGHEIAHVMAGAFARGPFLVAGGVGGWLPDPGLIEGIAVAAAPDDDILTPMQWSAAMLKLDLLPSLDTVFALGFLGKNSSMAYTVAGAFVQWVADTHGMDVVRRWYGGGNLDGLVGEGLAHLEVAWRKNLGVMEITDAELAQARTRFDRPGVFKRICPHAVDAFHRDGAGLASQGDCATALLLFEKAVALDPLHMRSRVSIASCSARVAGGDVAKERWQAIAEDGMMPETVRFRALEELADLALVRGDGPRAEETYSLLLTKIANEDQLRTLDVKLRAVRNQGERRAVQALLLGDVGRGPDQRLAFSLLGARMVEAPGDGLAAYLIGRGLVGTEAWSSASEFLDRALERDLSEPRIRREALRLRIVAACAQGDSVSGREFMKRWKEEPGLQEVRWLALERRLGECVKE